MSLIRHVQSPTVKGTEKRFSFTFQCVCFSFDSQEIIAAIDRLVFGFNEEEIILLFIFIMFDFTAHAVT